MKTLRENSRKPRGRTGRTKCNGALSLTFLLYPSEDSPSRVVAHCLELDLVSVEETEDKAILLLKELISDLYEAAQADGTLEKLVRPAPQKYWQMLLKAEPYKPPSNVTKRHINAQAVVGVTYALACG